jgi:receptor protein-tyrosine kinase
MLGAVFTMMPTGGGSSYSYSYSYYGPDPVDRPASSDAASTST